MPARRLLAGTLGAALCLAAPAARADSQSSNSSSNCSNGRCIRVDSLVVQDDRGRQGGWYQVERWRERPHDRRFQRPWRWQEDGRGHRSRRDRGDDDDD